MSSITILSAITKGRAMSCYSLGVRTLAATGGYNAANDWADSCVIIIGRQREKGRRPYTSQWDLKHSSRTRHDVLYRRRAGNRAHKTETRTSGSKQCA